MTGATVDVRQSNCTTPSTSFNSGDTVCAHSVITQTSNGNSGDIDVMWMNQLGQLVGTAIVHSGVPTAAFDDRLVVSAAGSWTVVVCTNATFPCGKNQSSKVRLLVKGQMVDLIATTDDPGEIGAREEVLVVEVKEGTAVVARNPINHKGSDS